MTKSQAGRLGGLSTYKKHGKIHMRNIGILGAKVTWTLYSIKPVSTSQYAMVRREDGKIVAFLSPWRM